MTRAPTLLTLLRLAALALAGGLILYLAWIGYDTLVPGMQGPRLSAVTSVDFGERILVIAPHPDDEVLGAGGLIGQSLANGGRVRVVIATAGDGYRRIAGRYAPHTAGPRRAMFTALGRARSAESSAALAALGLPADDVIFLGYPDGALSTMLGSGDGTDTPVRAVNECTSVPYPFALRPGAPYVDRELVQDLVSVVAGFHPTAIVFPDGEDANADHWALSGVVQDVLARTSYAGKRYTYLVHRGHFPFPWSRVPKGNIVPPTTVRNLGIQWMSYSLSADAEAKKAAALGRFASQRRVMQPFLEAFVRRNELFGRDEDTTASLHTTATPLLDANTMPGIVVSDPHGDTLMRLLAPEADLVHVALVGASGRVYAGVETRGGIPGNGRYVIGLRIVGPATARRLEVVVRGSKAEVRSLDGTVTVLRAPARATGRRLWIELPERDFSGATVAVVSAEAYAGGLLADRTAWRTVRLR